MNSQNPMTDFVIMSFLGVSFFIASISLLEVYLCLFYITSYVKKKSSCKKAKWLLE